MARGGINKAVVQKARDTLIARGINPSIAAVRIELGNTGSNSSIVRYLRELETVAPAFKDRQQSLSEELTGLVARLVERLQEEGSHEVSTAKAEFEQERTELKARLDELEVALASRQREKDLLKATLQAQSEELLTCTSSLQSELSRNARLSQSVADLETRIGEKDAHVQSLEEKHAHARDALEHYRTAIKEQREQDERRHETQLQQLQHQMLQLQQTLMVRQDELSHLNRDNERLLGEARQQDKLARQNQDTLKRLQGDLTVANMATARAEGAKEMLQTELADAKRATEFANAEIRQLNAASAELSQQLANATKALNRCKNAAANKGRSEEGKSED